MSLVIIKFIYWLFPCMPVLFWRNVLNKPVIDYFHVCQCFFAGMFWISQLEDIYSKKGRQALFKPANADTFLAVPCIGRDKQQPEISLHSPASCLWNYSFQHIWERLSIWDEKKSMIFTGITIGITSNSLNNKSKKSSYGLKSDSAEVMQGRSIFDDWVNNKKSRISYLPYDYLLNVSTFTHLFML